MSENRKNGFWKWALVALVVLLIVGGGVAVYMLRGGGGIIAGGLPEIELQDVNGHRLMVNGKNFIIRGVCYNPVPVGENFKYDFFGKDSPALTVDGDLMKAANINTIRLYRAGDKPEDVKAVINGLYKKHGIYTLLGHHLAFWDWPPANYADPQFQEEIKRQVLEMVQTYKNEPGVLCWILGNENNYSFDLDVRPWTNDAIDALPTPEERRLERARIYYTFINDMAREIKKIDSRHPVIMGVGETKSLDVAAKCATDIDILGMIAYRGSSFGNLFREVKQKMDIPVVLIEFGCDRF
jgi:beta-galactosidase/beta-glucuronidase